MLLAESHFDEWSLKFRNELLSILYIKFTDTFNLSKNYIRDIIVSGSRVFRTKNYVFKKESDLDIGIILEKDVFDKYFLPIEWMGKSNKYLEQLMKDNPDKFKPKITGFDFYGVRLSIFIRKWKGENIFYNEFLGKYNLPYFSLIEDKYVSGNTRHLYDYLIHFKNRLEPYSFCFICCEEKESPFIISIKFVDNFRKLDKIKFDMLNQIYICKECCDKIFTTRSFDDLWGTLNEKVYNSS